MNGRAYDFLPENLRTYALLNQKDLFEIRIRADKPITANIKGSFVMVTYKNQPIIMNRSDIKNIIMNVCKNSVYAYNDTLTKGYVTSGGIRIGIAGKIVREHGKIITINDFSSLCIRIPHEIKGCANGIFDVIYDALTGTVGSLLIVSPPGTGKTTVLRDLTRIVSLTTKKNILVIDEKDELYNVDFDLGDTADVISGSDKRFGFYTAIRNLCPDIIVTDELTGESDVDGVVFAAKSGVTVFATVHGGSICDAESKSYLQKAFSAKCFDYAVFLERSNDCLSIKVKRYKGGEK